jgi:hypothetical protein
MPDTVFFSDYSRYLPQGNIICTCSISDWLLLRWITSVGNGHSRATASSRRSKETLCSASHRGYQPWKSHRYASYYPILQCCTTVFKQYHVSIISGDCIRELLMSVRLVNILTKCMIVFLSPTRLKLWEWLEIGRGCFFPYFSHCTVHADCPEHSMVLYISY